MIKLTTLALLLFLGGSQASVSSSEMSAMPASELQAKQVEVEAKQAALRKLVTDVEHQNEDESAPSTRVEGKEKDTSRSNVARENEKSLAQILPVTKGVRMTSAYARLEAELEGQDADRAKTTLSEFLRHYPEHRDARLQLAREYVVSGEAQKALEVVESLTTTGHENSHPDWQPWFWSASAHLALGNAVLAREQLELALTKESEVADVWVQLAVVEQELDNHAGALQYLNIAERLQPRLGSIHLNKAYSLEHLEEFDGAINAYQRYLVADDATSSGAARRIVLRRLSELAGMQANLVADVAADP